MELIMLVLAITEVVLLLVVFVLLVVDMVPIEITSTLVDYLGLEVVEI